MSARIDTVLLTMKPLAGKTILIVEDEFLIALEAQHLVENAGASEVVLANSVRDVRMLLADGPQIDVAILDLKLGAEDATPLIEEFTSRTIPILVTTGFDRGAPPGVKVLTKPYRDTQFIDAVQQLVHGHS